jgi:hypothetical protein
MAAIVSLEMNLAAVLGETFLCLFRHPEGTDAVLLGMVQIKRMPFCSFERRYALGKLVSMNT